MFNPGTIPRELRERPQWICWKEATRNGKATKVPKQPNSTGANAKANDMATWGSFEEAIETAERRGWGIGFVFSSADPYIGIDIDSCLRDDGGPRDWLPGLAPFIGETFIERSPSGTGLHVIVKDDTTPSWWVNQDRDTEQGHEGIEVYEDGRYFTVTGDILEPESADCIGSDLNLPDWLETCWMEFNNESPTEAKNTGSTNSTGGEDINIDVHDVVFSSEHPEGERSEHPIHGSDTGSNFMVDDGAETWRCWRHSCTGNALHLIGMQHSIIECGDWAGSGLDTDTWSEIFDAAREDGYDLPEKQSGKPKRDVPDSLQGAQTDGGVEATTGTTATTSSYSIEDRIMDEVIIPLNPDQYDVEGVDQITQDTAINRVADIFCDEYYFLRPRDDTMAWRDTLYVYIDEEGIYEPHGEIFVEQKAERLLGDVANNTRVRELAKKIERRSRVNSRRLDEPPERLVVANGILDLTTGGLDPHSPHEFHKQRIDVAWNPDADCPAIDEFLHDIVRKKDVPLLYQFISHSLYREYAAQKAAMLLGEGQNGKSVFLSLVEQFLGEFNVSHQSLQSLQENDFAANNLVGKLANVHPDMSDQTVDTMQMFKKLTGRDIIDANVKFEKPVRFENYATLMFACNRMPVLRDDTRGNWRRWVLVNFPNTFEGDDKTPKRVLMRRMTQDSELEGLLARCVEEIKSWNDGRDWFPSAPGWETVRTQIRRAAEPVYDFAHACLKTADGDDAYVTADQARMCYRQYAAAEGLPGKSREQFGRELLNMVDFTIEKGQRRVGNGRATVYNGVAFTGRGKQLLGLESATDVRQDNLKNAGKSEEQSQKAKLKTVIEIVESKSRDDGHIPHPTLIGYCGAAGIEPDNAEYLVESLLKQGELTQHSEGVYRLT